MKIVPYSMYVTSNAQIVGALKKISRNDFVTDREHQGQIQPRDREPDHVGEPVDLGRDPEELRSEHPHPNASR
jgi:hypothetical protein